MIMHIMSSLLIYYTINVVHMYNNYSNKIHLFCNLSLSVYVAIIVFCIYKICGHVLIAKCMKKHAVETRVKLYTPVHLAASSFEH